MPLDQLRPRHAEKKERCIASEQGGRLDEVEEGLLRPLDVVEQHYQRCLFFEQLPEGPGDLLGARCRLALPQQRADRRRGRSVGGKDVQLFQHLHQRPVRDALAVGKAAAADGATIDQCQRLCHQAGLAHTRLADDGDELAARLRAHPLPARVDKRELALSADERGSMQSRGRGQKGRQTERRHRLGLALEHERLDRLRLDRVAHERQGGLADQDLARLRRLGSASRISIAARQARNASSSCTRGMPNTAITASPMNFSTVPPCDSTIAFIRSK